MILVFFHSRPLPHFHESQCSNIFQPVKKFCTQPGLLTVVFIPQSFPAACSLKKAAGTSQKVFVLFFAGLTNAPVYLHPVLSVLLIKKGRGNGPMKPWQPSIILQSSVRRRCQLHPPVTDGRDKSALSFEPSACRLTYSSSPDLRVGFFCACLPVTCLAPSFFFS